MNRRSREEGPQLDGPPLADAGSDPPVGSRRLRRLLLWALALAVLLVVGLSLLYNSAWTAERVRLLVEGRMSEYLERDVEVGRVEYGWRPGLFVLYDLVIPSPSPDDPPFAVVPRIEIQFALSGFTRLTIDIVRVEVERPEVHVLFDRDGRNNLPELGRPERDGPGRVEVVIGRLLVEGGVIHLDQLELPLEIDASSVRAFVQGAGEGPDGGDRFEAVAAAQDFRIVLPDARPWSGSVAGKGVFSPGRVDLTAGWARGPGLAARFSGFYAWADEAREAVIEIVAAGDASLARSLGYVEEAIGGRYGFTGRITIDDEEVAYGGTVTSGRLDYAGRVFTDLVAELTGDPRALVVDVERAGHAGGTLAGVVRVDLADAEGEDAAAGRMVDVDGRFSDLAIDAIIADLDLETDVLSRLTGRAGGELTYRFSSAAPLAGSGDVAIRLAAVRGAGEDLPLAGRARLTIRRGVLASDDVDLTAPGQRLTGSGRYELEAGRGQFDFRLTTQDPGRLLRALPAVEVGDPPPDWFPVAGHGSAVGSVAVGPDHLVVTADVELADLVTPSFELSVLRAPLELRDGVLSTTGLLASGPDQRLVASGRYDLDRQRGRFDFELATDDPGGLLRAVPALEVGDPPPPWFPLAGRGTVVGTVELAGGELAASVVLDLANVVTPAVDLTEVKGPVEVRGGVVSTTGLTAFGPDQRLTLRGSFAAAMERGEIDLHLVSEDLGQIAALVPQPPGQPAPWLPSGGTGTVEASLVVAPGPTVTGRVVFDLAAVETSSGRFDSVLGSFRLTPQALRDLRLEATADGGALIASGDVPLPLDAGELELAVEVVDFPVELLAAFSPQVPDVSGRLTARLDAFGSFDQLQGEASIDTGPVRIAGVELRTLDADVTFRGRRLVVDRLVAEMPAGTLSAVGTWNRVTGGLAFQVEGSDLELDRPPFSELVPGDLSGRLTVTATVEGTVGEPRIAARLVGDDLVLAGRSLGDEGRSAVNVRWSGDDFEARGSLLGLVSFDGGGRLTGERADLLFQVASDDLGALIQLGLDEPVDSELTGSFVGTLRVAGPYGDGVLPVFDLRLPTLILAYESRRIENLDPVAVRFADGVVVVDSLFLGAEDDSELFVVGSVEVTGAQALDLRLQADLDVAWLELLIPRSQLEGDIEALAVVSGTLSDPRFSGQAGLSDGEALIAGFPHAFEELEAVALIYPGRVVLDHLRAEVAGGDLRAAGVIEFVDLTAGRLDYRLQAEVVDVAVRFPEGFLLRGDAHLTLTTRADGRLLAGSVELERAFYLEDVPAGLGGLLQGVFQRSRLEVASADEDLAGTQLNIAVLGPDALRVRNNIANLEGDLDLVLRGTLARPVVLGQVEVAAGGSVVYADNDYRVERGLLTFANPRRIDPVIDFVATTEVRSFDITLNLDGTIDRLNATFTSDPPLADLEIVSLLTTGQPITDSGRLFAGGTAAAPGAPGAAAQQFLYGQAASVISERVNTLFGFDRFRVAPVTATGAGQSSLAFTVGKQITRDLFVTYSRDPSTSDLDILQVEWEVRDNVVVVLTQRGDGSYAVDVQVERRF